MERSKDTSETHYVSLSAVHASEKKNVFVVVRDANAAKRTKNQDLIVNCKVSDPSWNEAPLSVNLFFAPDSTVPRIQNGMILRIKNMKLEVRPNGNPMGVGYKSTITVFDGTIGASITPLYSSGPTTSLSQDERERIENLRQFVFQLDPLETPFLKSIATAEPQKNFDLVAKVVFSSGRSSDEYGKCIVRVWDGTHNPHCKLVQQNEQLPCSLLTVEAYGEHVSVLIESDPVGAWFKFRNIKGKIWDDNFTTSTSYYSSLQRLKEDDPNVRMVLSRFRERVEKKPDQTGPKNTQDALITVLPAALALPPELSRPPAKPEPPAPKPPPTLVPYSVPVTPIQEILSHSRSPWRFCCSARVVAYYPQDPREWTQPRCPYCKQQCSRDLQQNRTRYQCNSCKRSVSPTFVFRMRLQLRDGSACMVALLGDQNARDFFGVEPVDLYENNVSNSILSRKMQDLQQSTAPSNFCLQSYTPQGFSERKYQVFDTRLT